MIGLVGLGWVGLSEDKLGLSWVGLGEDRLGSLRLGEN